MPSHRESSRARYRRYTNERGTEAATAQAAAQGAIVPSTRSRRRSFGDLLRHFLQLLRGHRLPITLALGTLTLATLLNLIPPAATKVVIDNVLGDRPLAPVLSEWLGLPSDPGRLLAVVALGIFGISVVSITLGMWGRWQATKATKKLQAGIRRRVFEHAGRLPLHRVYALKSGGVASILREDAGGVAELIFSMLYNPWRAVIQLTGTLIILTVVDWRLMVGSLLLLPTVYLTHRTWIARVRPLFRDIRSTRQHIDTHATEAFGGMRVVRTFGRQRSEAARFTRNNHLMARQELAAWWWSRTVEVVWAVLIPGATALLLYFGGKRVLSDDAEMTAGDLIMFLAYLVMLLGPLAILASSATQFQNSLAGLDRVLDLLAEPQEMVPTAGAAIVEPAGVVGRITFRDVSFSYPGSSRRVVHGANLEVAAGQTVALIGRSGAGKTTLCNLVARFYDPVEGTIELDGRDLRLIDVESYRRLLGIVEQDIFLFDGTIAQNIGYARRGAAPREIERVAVLAHAHEFICGLENGYDTVIGERGVRLSGGQRQRLAIARAMLADPRILILDEATSNLDTESERFIQASLTALMEGRTTFVIAHRLSTVMHADRIVLMEAGRIIDQGTHEELMAVSPTYQQMIFMQLEGGASTPPTRELIHLGGEEAPLAARGDPAAREPRPIA
ncbi:MAG: ABC transporter ATP-binding protein [Planctomycetes bacterium]|nr:ABC transporter ATP-binding protein [Planctomycetota bacterium]